MSNAMCINDDILTDLSFLFFLLNGGQIIKILSHHLCNQLYPWKLFRFILSHQTAVSEHGNPVTDFIDLFQKMSHKNDSDSFGFQTLHQLKQLLHLAVVKGRGRLIKD